MAQRNSLPQVHFLSSRKPEGVTGIPCIKLHRYQSSHNLPIRNLFFDQSQNTPPKYLFRVMQIPPAGSYLIPAMIDFGNGS